MFKIGTENIYLRDELSSMADPAGSYRIPCMLIRRCHPASEEGCRLDYGYVNLGMAFIDEYSPEFKEYTAEIAAGVVCCELHQKYSYWRRKNARWERIEWLEENE